MRDRPLRARCRIQLDGTKLAAMTGTIYLSAIRCERDHNHDGTHQAKIGGFPSQWGDSWGVDPCDAARALV